MNDLNTINRQNAEAIKRNIPQLLAAGHHVVLEYAGLHFIGTHTFKGDTPEGTALQRAQARLQELNARNDSTRAELKSPPAEATPELQAA